MSENLMSNDYTKLAVSISRFEEGEAERILEELNETGFKAVLNNGLPCGILVSLELYKEYVLLLQAYREIIYGEDPHFNNSVQQFAMGLELLKKVPKTKFSSRMPEADSELH